MADKAINQYQTKTTLDNNVVFPVGTGTTTMKVSLNRLKESLSDGLVMSDQGKYNAGKMFVVDNDGIVRLRSATELGTTIIPLTVSKNGVYTAPLRTAYSPVTVNVSGGGGGDATGAVIFYDYDGSVVTSYTAAEFAELSAMPENPTHTGLTAQGWNWTLADAKAHVQDYGRLNIGQMYVTDDGKTRIYIHLSEGRTSPMLGLCPNGTVDVDWGDGTAHDTLTGTSLDEDEWTPNHTYAAPGDYVIKLTVTGSAGFYGSYDLNELSRILRYSSGADKRNGIYQNAIKKIEVGNGVTDIGDCAFYGCTGLTSVTIPNSVTSIDSSAFYGCTGLTSITIPNSVTSIGDEAFRNCTRLMSVTIPNSVTEIGRSVFWGCSGLTSVTIPNSVTKIDNGVFSGCIGLTSITIPNSVTKIGNGVFSDCIGLTSVTIPNSVTKISEGMFSGCIGLTSVTIPNSVTEIGNGVFSGCTGLTSITIPNSVTKIGYWTFDDCTGLTSITIPNSVTSIGPYAFRNCTRLMSVTIPNSVTEIGHSVFWGCSGLTSVTIPNSVTSIGYEAFYKCYNLTSITIPNSVTSIDINAFGASGLTSVTIPNSVTNIIGGVFGNCPNLTSVTIPNSVTSIGIGMFSFCPNLTSVTIPNSVTKIDKEAFMNCTGLGLIRFVPTTPPTAGSSTFTNIPTDCKIYVPTGSLAAYQSAANYPDPTVYTYIEE